MRPTYNGRIWPVPLQRRRQYSQIDGIRHGCNVISLCLLLNAAHPLSHAYDVARIDGLRQQFWLLTKSVLAVGLSLLRSNGSALDSTIIVQVWIVLKRPSMLYSCEHLFTCRRLLRSPSALSRRVVRDKKGSCHCPSRPRHCLQFILFQADCTMDVPMPNALLTTPEADSKVPAYTCGPCFVLTVFTCDLLCIRRFPSTPLM